MSSTPAFTPQLIGQTEKTLNAILDRNLAGTGLTEPQWVVLTLAVRSGGPIDRNLFASSVATSAKFSEADVRARIAELAERLLLTASTGEGAEVAVTDAGEELHGRILATNTELIERLWGDLPASDLAMAGRVLAIVLERANAEIAVA